MMMHKLVYSTSLIQEWVPVALYCGIVRVPPFLQLGHFDTRGGSQQRDVVLNLLGSEVLHRHNTTISNHYTEEDDTTKRSVPSPACQ